MAVRGKSRREKVAAVTLVFSPKRDSTRVGIYLDGGVLGDDSWVPTGHLGLHLVARDLVGLTPAAATLKCLHHAVRTLEHVVQAQRAAARSGAPLGATGGTVPIQSAMVWTDARARELVLP